MILLIILTLALIVLALNLIGAIFTGAAYIIDYIEVIALIVGIVFIVRHFINKKKNQWWFFYFFNWKERAWLIYLRHQSYFSNGMDLSF